MAQSIRPVFTFDLNSKIVSGRVTVGIYDGSHPCLTVATTADKVTSEIQFIKIVNNVFYLGVNPQSPQEISVANW